MTCTNPYEPRALLVRLATAYAQQVSANKTWIRLSLVQRLAAWRLAPLTQEEEAAL